MGKIEEQIDNGEGGRERERERGLLCMGCSMGVTRFANNHFSFKCLFVLILGFAVLLPGIFWVIPGHSIKIGFDANEAIKLSATVQASFKLEKPVSQLIRHIINLEYDIYGEIGLPETKVVVLSMHQSGVPNWTDVVFGILSNPIHAAMHPVSLSVLRSSFIELFLQQSNLTLTTSIFGNASLFEILKFPGGVTVIPVHSTPIWQIPQILFNFTLNNSISEILDNFIDFKDQLKYGLHLRPYEDVFVQITKVNGSTVVPPIIVQASVVSDYGTIQQQRLKQLAETIKGSPAKNLGLDNSVFGKVKSISLSSYLKDKLHSTPTTPSPAPALAPSPELSNYPSVSPYSPPSYSPESSSAVQPKTCHNCKVSSPAPSIVTKRSPCPSASCGFGYSPATSPISLPKSTAPPSDLPASPAPFSRSSMLTSDLSPVFSPRPRQNKRNARNLVSPSLPPSPYSSAVVHSFKEMQLFGFSGLLIFYLLYRS